MLDKIYLNSPYWLQNLGLTLYGIKSYRERFVGDIPEVYSDMRPTLSEASKETMEMQDARLKALLEHASAYVPYYRKILKDVAVSEISADNISNYIPKLTKETILAAPTEFLSEHPAFQKDCLTLNTSGSTGTPLKIICSRESRRINYHFYALALREKGLEYRSKSTTFAGRVLYSEKTKRFDRYDYFNKTQYLSTYYISADNIERYIDALNQWSPEYIDSYPSALFEIQLLARKKGLTLTFKPKLILTSSETLSLQAKEEIESFFGASIMDHYGCTEMVVSAFSKNGKYYIDPLYSVVELDSQGDNRFSLVVTGLLNFAMPLIRYDIGDDVVSDNPSNPYVFDYVEGRRDDVIITPEGRRIGRIDPAFKGVSGILQSQVVQDSLQSITVKVVLNKSSAEAFDELKLINNIKQRTSQAINVNISYQDFIAREKNGKYKSVISNISKPNA